MTADLDKTVTLIRKLLALANDGAATEHEAALALSKAQELMGAANLTIAQCEASGASGGEGSRRVKDGVESRSPYKWHRDLMTAIASINTVWCEVKFKKLSHTNMFDGYELIGREANVASTRVMYEYLIEAVERVLRDHVDGDAKRFFDKYANSFKQGAASRVIERLKERQEQILATQEREAREAKTRAAHPSYAGSGVVVVVMRDFYQDEKDLNNDMRRGVAPGATASERQQTEQRIAVRVRQKAERLEQILIENPGIDKEVAEWMAGGWTRADAERVLNEWRNPKPAKPETDAQRRKREAREQVENRCYWNRASSAERKLDSSGYRAGRMAGDGVGLDRQAAYDAKQRLN